MLCQPKGDTMELTVPDRIHHGNIFVEYVNMQATYLSRILNVPAESLIPKIQAIVKERYQPKRVEILKTTSYGNVKQINQDLWTTINRSEGSIITPSGSAYKPTYKCHSIMSKMVTDMLNERKKVKKQQLKAAGAGDDVTAKMCWYKQASIKITVNSIPGGFGSPFNIFFDKGGYNGITSSARCMIARAYTICEQLLGGNFSWFSVNELINFIILHLRTKPSDAQIEKCMEIYHLKVPTKDMLMEFYRTTMARYIPSADLTPVQNLVNTLSQNETTFLYYYCNLRHIIWENENIFRPWIARLFNVDNLEIDENVTKDDAFAIDETVVAVTTVAFTDKLGGYGMVDICTDHPEFIPKLVAYCRVTEKRLHELNYLMDTFVNTLADIPMTHLKPFTWRNTTIVSDTDSVIFTSGAWDDWYRHNEYQITHESYQIASLTIYWLHHAVKFALKRFSIAMGYIPDETNRLSMKNEFLFPVMIIYPIKKTYVGLQRIQEGVVYKTPKLDIKGQTLRGSTIAAKSKAFFSDLINNDILNASMVKPIDGNYIIDKVIAFETNIRTQIESGNIEFLKNTSLRYERDYKNPEETSVFVAWSFWEYVMTAKYDHIHPPTKVYIFRVKTPTTEYYKWLQSTSKKIYNKMTEYLDGFKKLPNQLIIDPVIGHIPEEFIPLIDTRHVIYENLVPVYESLKRLNIAVGCESKQLLFNDVY